VSGSGSMSMGELEIIDQRSDDRDPEGSVSSYYIIEWSKYLHEIVPG
jgi:hypothetical protein